MRRGGGSLNEVEKEEQVLTFMVDIDCKLDRI